MFKKYTRAQIWEFSIIVTIVLLVLYRSALVYDYLPDSYHPSTIFYNIYGDFKNSLIRESAQGGMLGHAADWTLGRLKITEKYLHEQEVRYKHAEEIAARCNENMIFRYFMYMGEESNSDCTERDMALKEAVKQLDEGAATAPAGESPNVTSTAPQETTSAPVEQPTAAPAPAPNTQNSPGAPSGRQPVSITTPY